MENNQETKPLCAINGVFVVGKMMAACAKHGGGNMCYDTEPCEHKIAPQPKDESE